MPFKKKSILRRNLVFAIMVVLAIILPFFLHSQTPISSMIPSTTNFDSIWAATATHDPVTGWHTNRTSLQRLLDSMACCDETGLQAEVDPFWQAASYANVLQMMINDPGPNQEAFVRDSIRGGHFYKISAFIAKLNNIVVDSGMVFPTADTNYYMMRDIGQATAINVKWYGAKGDSANDDGDAIRTAMRFVRQYGGGTVYIPSGIYIVSRNPASPFDMFLLSSNMRVVGAGIGKTKLKLNPVDTFNFRRMFANINLSSYGNINNFEIGYMEIDMSNTFTHYPPGDPNFPDAQNSGIFLFADGGRKIRNGWVHDLYIHDVTGDIINASTNCANLVIERIYQRDYLRQGVGVGGSGDSVRNIYIKNIYDLTNKSGVIPGGNSIHCEPSGTVHNLTYRDCVINNFSLSDCDGATIDNIHIIDSNGVESNCNRVKNFTISKCVFESKNSLQIAPNGDNVIADNNTFNDGGLTMTSVSGLLQNKNIRITNNCINSKGAIAVKANDQGNVFISGNQIKADSLVSGVSITNCTAATVSNNTIRVERPSSSSYCILLTNSITTILGNGVNSIYGNTLVNHWGRAMNVTSCAVQIGNNVIEVSPNLTPILTSGAYLKLLPFFDGDKKVLNISSMPNYGFWRLGDIINISNSAIGSTTKMVCTTSGGLSEEAWSISGVYHLNNYVKGSNGHTYVSVANQGQLEDPTTDTDTTFWMDVASTDAIFQPIDRVGLYYSGSGSPEGVVSASVGAIYHRLNGSSGTTLYIKETGSTGNTGWVAVGSSGGGGISANFANTDLTATGDRWHHFKGNFLFIDSLDYFRIQLSGHTTREYLFKGSLVDAPNEWIFLGNGTSAGGQFSPTFGGHTERTNSSVTVTNYINPSQDSAITSNPGNPLVRVVGFTTTSNTDPLNGTLAKVDNRDMFAVNNGGGTNGTDVFWIGPKGEIKGTKYKNNNAEDSLLSVTTTGLFKLTRKTRFGIEDSISTVDRKMNMQSHVLNIVASQVGINTSAGNNIADFQVGNPTLLGLSAGRSKVALEGLIYNANVGSVNAGFYAVAVGDDVNTYSLYSGRKAHGTPTALLPTLNADTLLKVGAGGYNGSSWDAFNLAGMIVLADGDFTTTSRPTKLSFATSDIGTVREFPRFNINADGSIRALKYGQGNFPGTVTTIAGFTSDGTFIDVDPLTLGSGGSGGSGSGSTPVMVTTALAGAIGSSATQFNQVYGRGSTWTTEANVQSIVPVDCNASALVVRTNSTQSATGGLVITLRVNGINTALTVVVPPSGLSGAYSNNVNTVALHKNDLVAWQVQNLATTTSTVIRGIGFALSGGGGVGGIETDSIALSKTVTINVGAGLQRTSGSATQQVGSSPSFTLADQNLRANTTASIPLISANSFFDFTVAVSGAALNDPVEIGSQYVSASNIQYTGYVSSTNVVTVRVSNFSSSPVIFSANWPIHIIVLK